MVHMHYSPYQFATNVGIEGDDLQSGKKVRKVTKRLTARDKLPKPALLSCEEAKMIPGTPNAFISPNSTDVMRMIKNVFGV
jgi:hypothetical protein